MDSITYENRGKNKIKVILEPLAHEYTLDVGSLIEVSPQDDEKVSSVEIYHFEDSVQIYCWVYTNVRIDGVLQTIYV